MSYVFLRIALQNYPLQERYVRQRSSLTYVQELLVATRHVLSTDFRGAFLSKIDILSNEKVLVGAGITSHETLRLSYYRNHLIVDPSPTVCWQTFSIMSVRNLIQLNFVGRLQFILQTCMTSRLHLVFRLCVPSCF